MKLLQTIRLVIILTIFSFAISVPLSSQLVPGDIMFVAFEFDGDGTPENPYNCGDGFAFVNLVSLPAGTEIIFTEEDYHNNAFGDGEGDLIWTNDTGQPLPIGCVVEITTNRENCTVCNSLESSVGTASFVQGNGDWILTASNEELYAYIGEPRAPQQWLAGLTTNNAAIRAGTNTPPDELLGLMVDLTEVDQHADLAVYSGSTGCPDKKACIDLILDVESNWTTEDDIENDCCDDEGIDYPEDIPGKFGSVMPVRLITFNATPRGKNVMLKWETGSEINNDGFEVQRSSDGISWASLDFIKGRGTSNRLANYDYLDGRASRGVNFYRLKQMDYNGAYSYSSVVNAFVTFSSNTFTISPNPLKDQIRILGAEGTMSIFDHAGKLVSDFTLTGSETTLDLSHLNPGLYLVEIIDSQGFIKKTKLIKQ